MIDVTTNIIRRAQNGDRDILGGLYERFHVSVYRYLYYRVGDHQTAEDLTSEVFERMLRFLSGFHPPSAAFQAWLFQIARNLCNDHFRKVSKREHISLEEDRLVDPAGSMTGVEKILTSETLRKALDELNEDQRDVIILRFITGMSIQDVALSLNKSEDAVKGLQRRGLIALRQTLQTWEINYDHQ